MARTTFDKGEVEIGAESGARVKDVIEVTPVASSPLQPEVKIALQVRKVAMRECWFVKDTSFNELENLHELEACSALHQNVSLVLAKLSYSTRSARVQASSAHGVLSQRRH